MPEDQQSLQYQHIDISISRNSITAANVLFTYCQRQQNQQQNDTCLMAIFQDNLGKLVQECCHSEFYCSNDVGGWW